MNQEYEEIFSTWWASNLTSNKIGKKGVGGLGGGGGREALLIILYIAMKRSTEMEGD